MTAIVFKFDTPANVSPTILDGVRIRFGFTFIDFVHIGTPNQNSEAKQSKIAVQASRSLLDTWSLDDESLEKILFQIAMEHIRSVFGDDGVLPNEILLTIDTNTYSGACPFEPELIEKPAGAIFQIEIK